MGRRAGFSEHNNASHGNSEEVLLRKFVFRRKFPTILLVGKRNSGKSWTAAHIASELNMPRWCAWCGTKSAEEFWADKFKCRASVKGANEEGIAFLAKQIEYQERKVQLFKQTGVEFPAEYTLGMVFDDVTSKRKFRKGDILEELFSNGRHFKAVIIISCQYIRQLPPAVRLQSDYMFMMHNAKSVIKILHSEFVDEPDEFQMFNSLLTGVTSEKDARGKKLFNALVFDNTEGSPDWQDNFKIHSTPDGFHPDQVVLGSPEWHLFNEQHFHDSKREMVKQEYRRKKHLERTQRWQERQRQLRETYGQAYAEYATEQPLDVDAFGDSSDEDTDENDWEDLQSPTRGIQLRQKNGKIIRVRYETETEKDPTTLRRDAGTFREPVVDAHANEYYPQEPADARAYYDHMLAAYPSLDPARTQEATNGVAGYPYPDENYYHAPQEHGYGYDYNQDYDRGYGYEYRNT